MTEWLALVGIIITGAVTWGTQRLGSRVDARHNEQQGSLRWAEALLARLETVETRVEDLESDLRDTQRLVRAAAQFIDRVGAWLHAGRKGPSPAPPAAIHDHIDTTLWPTRPETPGDGDPT